MVRLGGDAFTVSSSSQTSTSCARHARPSSRTPFCARTSRRARPPSCGPCDPCSACRDGACPSCPCGRDGARNACGPSCTSCPPCARACARTHRASCGVPSRGAHRRTSCSS